MHTQAVELDQLASLARTALTDPAGLPDDTAALLARSERRAVLPDEDPCVTYAIDRLDEIINALNPAEWTTDNAALALRTLGRHMSEVMDALTAMHEEADDWLRPKFAADAIDTALDHIDSAIRTLEDEDE